VLIVAYFLNSLPIKIQNTVIEVPCISIKTGPTIKVGFKQVKANLLSVSLKTDSRFN